MSKLGLTDKFVAGVRPGNVQTDYFDAKCTGLGASRRQERGQSLVRVLHLAEGWQAGEGHTGPVPSDYARRCPEDGIRGEGAPLRRVSTRAMWRPAPLTVRQLVDSYLAKHVRPNLRSANAVERRLGKNMLPVIGGLALRDLHKRDINRVVNSIVDRDCQVEAARVFQDMRALFRWAVARGDLDHNPMEGMRAPHAPKPRERVLSDEEVRALWEALPEALPRSKAVQRIIKLCLLTAQRVGEVSGMHRDELDLDAGIWTIPAARSKNKRSHAVPLSEAAIALITDDIDGGYLFPNDNGDGPLPAHAVAKTIRLAHERFGIEHWTAHDLSRTAVTNMARLGVSPIVLGHVINHISVTKAGVTLSVYSQYDYAKEKREALELWAAHLDAIVRGGAKVLPIRGTR